jgi:hypothetical protein
VYPEHCWKPKPVRYILGPPLSLFFKRGWFLGVFSLSLACSSLTKPFLPAWPQVCLQGRPLPSASPAPHLPSLFCQPGLRCVSKDCLFPQPRLLLTYRAFSASLASGVSPRAASSLSLPCSSLTEPFLPAWPQGCLQGRPLPSASPAPHLPSLFCQPGLRCVSKGGLFPQPRLFLTYRAFSASLASGVSRRAASSLSLACSSLTQPFLPAWPQVCLEGRPLPSA